MVTTIHHPITIDRQIAVDAASSFIKRLGIKRWYAFVETQIKVAGQLSHFITDSENSLNEIIEGFGLNRNNSGLSIAVLTRMFLEKMPGCDRSNNRYTGDQ